MRGVIATAIVASFIGFVVGVLSVPTPVTTKSCWVDQYGNLYDYNAKEK